MTSRFTPPRRGMSESAAVIALLQFNATQSSRMFFDHESLAAALDNICALYEKELKLLNPKIANITYDIADLYSYLDAAVQHLTR